MRTTRTKLPTEYIELGIAGCMVGRITKSPFVCGGGGLFSSAIVPDALRALLHTIVWRDSPFPQ